ncbi:MAG TPA: AMP-binding protein, partial [Verrucomicrobiae bacterium]|nr:AMP-binding protein [Verrucomicrobiae bacterium]
MSTDEIIWRPDPEAAGRTRMGRFMAGQGIATLAELQRRSVTEPEWYWDAVSRDLGFHWFAPYRRVLDTSKGIEWPRWFEGGRLNLADNSVDRHIAAGRGDKPAVITEAEDGTVRTLSYRELGAEVGRLANALKRLGIRPGDTVGILLPMCAEAVIATLAVVRIGAVYTPCFSGYGAQAVASRL